MKAKDFDQAFDNREDISAHLNLSSKRRPELEQEMVNVDCPVWMVHQLDKEARRLGVTIYFPKRILRRYH